MYLAVISSSVFPSPTPGYAGLEMVAYHCAAGLARLGHRVTLIAPDGSKCPGCDVIHTGPGGSWTEAQAYDRYWQSLPAFDAIIDHSWNKHSYVLKTEGRLNAPVLGVWHAPVDTMYQQLPPLERLCTVLLSDDQRAHYEALWNRPGRTCYNGVDPDFYKPMTVPRNDRALFLGRFSTVKGPDLAITAAQEVGVGLDLIGDFSITNEPELLAACQQHCDGEKIRLVGPAARGECVHWFSQNSFLMHANMRFREPFGLAPVEAMMCGMPVVAYDNGAMRETVRHGETGYLVRSHEEFVAACRELARPGAVDAQVRSACREWAMQFSVANMAARYDQLVKEAISGGW